MKEYASDIYADVIKNCDCVSAYNLIQRKCDYIAYECAIDVSGGDKEGLKKVGRLLGVVSDKFPGSRDCVLRAIDNLGKIEKYEDVKPLVWRVLCCIENPTGLIIEEEVKKRVALKTEKKDRETFKQIQRAEALQHIIKSKGERSGGAIAHDIFQMSIIEGVSIPKGAGYAEYQCKGSGAFVSWINIKRRTWPH